MTRDLVALLLANVVYFVLGAGIFACAGVVNRNRSSWRRLPAAYMTGIAAAVVPVSYVALAGIGVGWPVIGAATAVVALCGWFRLRRDKARRPVRVAGARSIAMRLDAAVAAVIVVSLAALVVQVGRAIAVRPLLESDGWAVWALRARILYELPADAPAVLENGRYGPAAYPHAMPTLEALAFRAIGGFDGTIVDLQLLGIVVAFFGTLWALSVPFARPAIVGIAALGIITAPHFLSQLWTNYVDIPLAVTTAGALVAACRWIESRGEERWALVPLVAALGLAGLLKNEGLLFVAAAAAPLLACAAVLGRRALRDAAFACTAVAVLVMPWRIYGYVRGLETADYALSDVFDVGRLVEQSSRVRPVAVELGTRIMQQGSWGLLPLAVGVTLVAALVCGRVMLALFSATWLLLAFGGLLVTYWISVLPVEYGLFNSSYRTIASLIVGGTAVTPLLLGRVGERSPSVQIR